MANYDSGPIQGHAVVSHDEWLAARRALLEQEKAFNKRRDELTRARRAMPWERVAKPYAFDTLEGRRTLADLFDGRRQLLVYHFMFAPDWTEGCKHCSFWADNFDGTPVHLAQRDVAFVAVSRASISKIEAFKKRMGWSFDWVSCGERGDFNHDFQVPFYAEDYEDREGISVFYKDSSGTIFHTYEAYARGIEPLNGAYHVLDMVPMGRDEGEGGPGWVRHHDRYP